MTEVSIIVLALALIILCFGQNKLRFRVNEFETFIYNNMENVHYPAIKNEFTEAWVVVDELRDEMNEIKEAIKDGEQDGNC